MGWWRCSWGRDPADGARKVVAMRGWRGSWVFAVVLVVWSAVAVSAVDAGRADSRPRVLVMLSGSVSSVAFDGTRAAALLRSSASASFRLELVDLVSERTVTTGPMAARAGASLLVFAGTTALVDVSTGIGNTEVGGYWSLVPIDGGPVRVIRRYHTFHEGAGLNCCPIIFGQGAAGQGTVLAYVIKHELYRVAAGRSVKVRAGVAHLWAVNKRRLLVERDEGGLALVSPAGGILRVLAPGSAVDAVAVSGALQGNTALVLRRRRLTDLKFSYLLDVYHASTGALVHSWKLPDAVDLSDYIAGPGIQLYGALALYPGRGGLTVIRLNDGRRARLPIARTAVNAHLGRDGLAYTVAAGEGRTAIDLLPAARLAALAAGGTPTPS